MVEAVKHLSMLATRSAAFSLLVTMLERMDRRCEGLLRVLTYHRVDEPEAQPALNPRLISATPEMFDRQMDFLAANYCVVSIGEVLSARRKGLMLPPRAVLITFDDAYRDFAEHAWPTLRRYGLPVTLFVPTAYPDQPQRVFWWDRLHQALCATARRDEIPTPLGRVPLATPEDRLRAAVRLVDYARTASPEAVAELIDGVCRELDAPPGVNGVLGWDELRRLAHEGVALAAHTQTHPLMSRMATETARAEAVGSLSDLRREIGEVPPVFSYPGGGVDDRVADALREEDVFKLAFTTRDGINDLRSADPLMLRRINVGQRTTVPILRARLLAGPLRARR